MSEFLKCVVLWSTVVDIVSWSHIPRTNFEHMPTVSVEQYAMVELSLQSAFLALKPQVILLKEPRPK